MGKWFLLLECALGYNNYSALLSGYFSTSLVKLMHPLIPAMGYISPMVLLFLVNPILHDQGYGFVMQT